MALVQSIIRSSKFDFTITLVDSKQDSCPLIVADVPWRLSFLQTGEENTLAVHLACDLEDKTDEWWVKAEGQLKIFLSTVDKKPIEINFKLQKFTNGVRQSSWQLIQCNKWIKIDTFAVECKIISRPLIREPIPVGPLSHEVKCTSQQLLMRLENVDKLEVVMKSSKFNVRGTTWYVQFEKQNEKLGVVLCKEKSDQHFSLYQEVTFTVKLDTFTEVVKTVERNFTHKFSSNIENWGWSEFLDWNEFTDKTTQFVQNNVAFFDITIDVGPWQPITQRKTLPSVKILEGCCSICMEPFKGKDVVGTICGHLFCRECITTSIKRSTNCPICDSTVTEDGLRKIFFVVRSFSVMRFLWII